LARRPAGYQIEAIFKWGKIKVFDIAGLDMPIGQEAMTELLVVAQRLTGVLVALDNGFMGEASSPYAKR
jgi:hypothetical protein